MSLAISPVCSLSSSRLKRSKQLASPTLSKRFTISLRGTDLKVFIGTDMIRHTTCFGFESQELEIGNKVRVGVMACSPSGGGAKATFRNFAFRALKD
jgi:regulation of enolase protein 1 (concanavalin A-like superfamily)